MPEQPTSDPGLFSENDAVRRAQEIADERQAATAAKMDKLLGDPRVRTLLETGQVAVASVLASEDATGTTELPRIATTPRSRPNRRGGRSYNEGSDSEHDEYWNAPAPELSSEETANSREQLRIVAEKMRLENAAKAYQADLAEELARADGKSSGPIARLRAKGFIPDPATGGKTVLRIRDSSHTSAR